MKASLIVGDSFNLFSQEINKIIKNNDFLIFNFKDNSIDDLLYEASTPNFDGSIKYIVVKNTPFFKTSDASDATKKLISFIINNTASYLLFTSDKVDNRLKITKIFKEANKIINLEVTYQNIYSYINCYIKENKYFIDNTTIKYLVSIYGLNIDLIYSEINKLFVYFIETKKIIYEDAINIISTPINNNIFKFIDAFLDKDISLSLSLLEDLTISKIDETMVVVMLAKQIRTILNIEILANKITTNEIMKKLKLMDWQLDKLYKVSFQYKKEELISYLLYLANLDYQIKSGQIDKNIALKTFIINSLT